MPHQAGYVSAAGYVPADLLQKQSVCPVVWSSGHIWDHHGRRRSSASDPVPRLPLKTLFSPPPGLAVDLPLPPWISTLVQWTHLGPPWTEFTPLLPAISWKSHLQATTSLSSTEAEYKSAGAGVQEVIATRNRLAELGVPPESATVLFEDNQGAIGLALNQVSNHRTRHIDIRHHFIRQHIEAGTVALRYISTMFMIADALTKALRTQKFNTFRRATMGSPPKPS